MLSLDKSWFWFASLDVLVPLCVYVLLQSVSERWKSKARTCKLHWRNASGRVSSLGYIGCCCWGESVSQNEGHSWHRHWEQQGLHACVPGGSSVSHSHWQPPSCCLQCGWISLPHHHHQGWKSPWFHFSGWLFPVFTSHSSGSASAASCCRVVGPEWQWCHGESGCSLSFLWFSYSRLPKLTLALKKSMSTDIVLMFRV